MSTLRNYLSIEELQKFADIDVTDEDEAYEQIAMAEELIDQYVGFQDKDLPGFLNGEVTAVEDEVVYDTDPRSPLAQANGSLNNCIFEVIGGAGVGQKARIISSDRAAKSITLADQLATPVDTTSIYRIFQLAKFPRRKDVTQGRDGLTYYKTIPDAVQRATAAQVAYIIEMGPDYFTGNDSDAGSESIGNYSYSQGGGAGAQQSATVKMISPKARTLLRGIVNRTGRLEA